MARFSKLQVLQTAADQAVVPLFWHSDIAVAIKVVEACYQGGGRILEFTNRGDYAHVVFEELNRYCESDLPDMILGVGSVTDTGTASMYMQVGANFIVTPALRPDVIRTCNRRKIPCMPGCGSLTEITQAEELGCDIVKLFPAGTYGASFVKAIKGPQPWTSIMPTGGLTTSEDNLKPWFDAGVVCVGLGSQLLSKDLIRNKNYDQISQKVKTVLALASKLKA